MADTTKDVCHECGEEIDPEEQYHETLKGELNCDSCYESAWQYPSTCYTFGETAEGEEVEAVHFTADFGDMENQELPKPVAEQVWKQTDGWRGYTEFKLKPGYTRIADGWTTGYPDDTVPRKQRIADVFERFQTGELVPPVPVWWIFGLTSNVFSQTTDIICRTGDHSTLKEWLEQHDIAIADLEYMLT